MKTPAIAFFLMIGTLTLQFPAAWSTAQAKEAPACSTGYHAAGWQQCPVDDIPGQPPLPCQKVNVCLPDCPQGYRQLTGSADELRGHPSCTVADRSTSECGPLNLELVYPRSVPVMWRWRAEISEKCAVSRMSAPPKAIYVDVAGNLERKATGQFRVVVGEDGRIKDSTLLAFHYTALPPNTAPMNSITPADISRMATESLTRLRFQPYSFRGRTIEFESTVTFPFVLRKKKN